MQIIWFSEIFCADSLDLDISPAISSLYTILDILVQKNYFWNKNAQFSRNKIVPSWHYQDVTCVKEGFKKKKV